MEIIMTDEEKFGEKIKCWVVDSGKKEEIGNVEFVKKCTQPMTVFRTIKIRIIK